VCFNILGEDMCYLVKICVLIQCCNAGCATKFKIQYFVQFTVLSLTMPTTICNTCLGMLVNGSEQTQYSNTQKQHNNKTQGFSRFPHHYRPKHSWVQWRYIVPIHNKKQELFIASSILMCSKYLLTYLLTPWSRVLLEKLTSKLWR